MTFETLILSTLLSIIKIYGVQIAELMPIENNNYPPSYRRGNGHWCKHDHVMIRLVMLSVYIAAVHQPILGQMRVNLPLNADSEIHTSMQIRNGDRYSPLCVCLLNVDV